MFGSLGFPEILFILVLALLVFGPKKLPEVGRTIGRALGEFRRATGDLKRSFDQEINAEAPPKPHRTPSTEIASAESAAGTGSESPTGPPGAETVDEALEEVQDEASDRDG